jgi:hypothetical protein
VGLLSVDTDEGKHEYAEATEIDDAARVENVILRCGQILLLVERPPDGLPDDQQSARCDS